MAKTTKKPDGVVLHTDISLRPTEDLIPYARNSRTHTEQQVAQIAASIREFGFTNPVLVDENGGIIAGHGRVMAAKALKLKEVPCLELAGLTDGQKRAYVIADNKLALNAGWDVELLTNELRDLSETSPDLMALTGFSDNEVDHLLQGWDADQEEVEGHGTTDEAAGSVIKVKCLPVERERIIETLTEALRDFTEVVIE